MKSKKERQKAAVPADILRVSLEQLDAPLKAPHEELDDEHSDVAHVIENDDDSVQEENKLKEAAFKAWSRADHVSSNPQGWDSKHFPHNDVEGKSDPWQSTLAHSEPASSSRIGLSTESSHVTFATHDHPQPTSSFEFGNMPIFGSPAFGSLSSDNGTSQSGQRLYGSVPPSQMTQSSEASFLPERRQHTMMSSFEPYLGFNPNAAPFNLPPPNTTEVTPFMVPSTMPFMNQLLPVGQLLFPPSGFFPSTQISHALPQQQLLTSTATQQAQPYYTPFPTASTQSHFPNQMPTYATSPSTTMESSRFIAKSSVAQRSRLIPTVERTIAADIQSETPSVDTLHTPGHTLMSSDQGNPELEATNSSMSEESVRRERGRGRGRGRGLVRGRGRILTPSRGGYTKRVDTQPRHTTVVNSTVAPPNAANDRAREIARLANEHAAKMAKS